MLPHTYNDNDGIGVRIDTLVDARVEIDSAKSQLQDTYVLMDALADDREGIWTDDERQEIRLIQKTAEALVDSCEENLEDIEDEIEGMKS